LDKAVEQRKGYSQDQIGLAADFLALV
jgi:hypothetical protein